ncbi:MAG: alanine--glyoxylate aminotransferase family protein [Thermomicrobiales bacterium]
MPYAETTETAHRWATERAVACWAWFAGDLTAADLQALRNAAPEIKRDGAIFAVVASAGGAPTTEERALADIVATGEAGAPWGLFAAMQAAGVTDVAKLGVLGRTRLALEAGRRAGAGAVIALAAQNPVERGPLLPAQPDAMIEAAEFAALDAARFASTRAHRQRVLLNPGPAVVSDRVHRAVGGPDLCHREPEYSDILEGVRRKLLAVAGVPDDWAMVMIAGSGTSALEAMTGAATRPGKKLLVCKNGIYGERVETIARRLGTPVVVVAASDLEPIDPQAVAAALDADPDIDAVAVIHHETTTGLLNPVQEIAAVAKARNVPVLVDAISSLGAEELDLADTGIDFVASTSNKCLHGLPGAAFILVSPRGQERIAAVPPRSLYFDLANYLKAQAKRTVPFTPSIPALYSLDAALDELADEGLENRKALYAARMAYLDEALTQLGLEPRVAPAHRSRSVRSLPLPEGIVYDDLHDRVKEEGYIIYAGLGDAAKTTFRVCALGALTVDALHGFIAALERAIARQPVAVGA